MTVIGSLVVNTAVDTTGATRGTRAFSRELGTVQGIAMRAAPVIAGVGIAAKIAGETFDRGWQLITDRAAKFDELVNSADRLGIGAERLQELSFAAGQTSNVLENQLIDSLANMERAIVDAEHGVGKGVMALDMLNLSAAEMSRLPVDEQLFRIADAMRTLDAGERQSIARRLGLDGELVTMLAQGRVGIEEVIAEAREMGLILNELGSRQLANTNDALDKMYTSLSAVGTELAAGFAPAVEMGANELAELVKGFFKWRDEVAAYIAGTSPEIVRAYQNEMRQIEKMRQLKELEARREASFQQRMAEQAAERAEREQEQLEERQAREAENAQERLRDRLADARKQVEQFHMKPIQAEIADLQAGGTDEVRNQIIQQLEMLDRLQQARQRNNKALDRQQELESRAASIIERNMTPLESLRKELAEIQELRKAGVLSDVQAIRAVEAANRTFEGAATADAGEGPRRGANAALQFGSIEAFRAIRDNREDDTPKKSLKELTVGNDLAREMIAEIKKVQQPAAVAAWP
jgi:hypothetical protein